MSELSGRDLFEARVQAAMRVMVGRKWPIDGSLRSYPEEAQPHGVIVCREAAIRMRRNEAKELVEKSTGWRFVA